MNSIAYTQAQTDYVIKRNGDTVNCKIVKIYNDRRVTCYINNEKTKFKPKDLRGFKFLDSEYEAGKARTTTIGFKSNKFLEKVCSGKINFYYIQVYEKIDDYNNFLAIDMYFLRPSGEYNTEFIPAGGFNWKKKLTKYFAYCPEFIEEIEKMPLFNINFPKIIKLYKEYCNQ